jgi:hypothetical protein
MPEVGFLRKREDKTVGARYFRARVTVAGLDAVSDSTSLAAHAVSETCYKSPVESKHAGGEHRRHAGCRAQIQRSFACLIWRNCTKP